MVHEVKTPCGVGGRTGGLYQRREPRVRPDQASSKRNLRAIDYSAAEVASRKAGFNKT